METITITKANALAAFKKADQHEKEWLKLLLGKEIVEIPVMDRVKTFKDVLDESGISEEEWNQQTQGLAPDLVAYQAIKLIVKVLNEGWAPNWDNSDEYKYHPYFKWTGAGFSCDDYDCVYSGSGVGSRLVFKSSDLAAYAATQFNDIYNQFLA